MPDQHVDRPDVDAQQCVQLTGPNRSIALENSPSIPIRRHTPEPRPRRQEPGKNVLAPGSRFLIPAATAGWPWRGCPTRSHPELDRETPQRRWYCVSRRGRVGRRPALPAGIRCQKTGTRTQGPGRTERRASAAASCLPVPRSRHPNAKTLPHRRYRATIHRASAILAPGSCLPAPERGVEQPGSSSGS